MSTNRRTILLGGLLAALLAAALAGCGGGSGPAPAPDPQAGDWGRLRWNQGSWR